MKTYKQKIQEAADTPFDNTGTDFIASDVNSAIAEAGAGVDTALNTPRYTILLTYNGTVGNNTFIGYTNLIPGDDTPIVVPVKSDLVEYTFSNNNSGADYTIELRKNSTTGTVFNTVSKTNTQFYTESNIDEPFNANDTIFVKYLDNGTNASDVGVLLVFKAVP